MDTTKILSEPKDKKVIRTTKTFQKAGEEPPLTTNSLRGIALRQFHSRGRPFITPHLRKKISQAENQVAQKATTSKSIKELDFISSSHIVLDNEDSDVAETENILKENVETDEQPEVQK